MNFSDSENKDPSESQGAGPDPERPVSQLPSQQTPLAAGYGHDPYAALRFRDYRLYVASGTIGVIGSQIQSVALGWEIYVRTDSTMALGWIGLARAIPVLLLALPAGQAADWFDRKSIILVSQVLSIFSALCLLALSVYQGPLTTHHDGFIHLMYGCIFLRSMFATFGQPARTSLLPQVVPSSAFANAITWNSSTFHMALVVGPVIGGFIIATSLPLAYCADAICILIAFILTLFLRCRPVERSTEAATLKGLAAGFRFVFRTKVLLATLTLDMLAVLSGSTTALLPIFAKDILKVGVEGLGWMRAAAAAGSCAMALLLAHLPPMKHAGRTLLWMVAGFGAATVAFGLSESFWISMSMLFLTGAFDNVSVVVRGTLVQVLSPNALRGRISAVNNMFISASNQLGELESGWVAGCFTPVFSAVSGGIGSILVVAMVAVIWPEVRRIGALHEIKADPSDEDSDKSKEPVQ